MDAMGKVIFLWTFGSHGIHHLEKPTSGTTTLSKSKFFGYQPKPTTKNTKQIFRAAIYLDKTISPFAKKNTEHFWESFHSKSWLPGDSSRDLFIL